MLLRVISDNEFVDQELNITFKSFTEVDNPHFFFNQTHFIARKKSYSLVILVSYGSISVYIFSG